MRNFIIVYWDPYYQSAYENIQEKNSKLEMIIH